MKHTTNLDFDGMAGTGVNRAANPYAHNQHTGHSNDGRAVNFGRGPTRAGTTGKTAGPATAAVGGPPHGTKQVAGYANTNKINVGSGPRKGNQ